MRISTTSIFAGMISFSLLFSGCAKPPFKEINAAQAAIDSASAVGAEKYAAVDYVMACDSLKTAVSIMNKQKPWILFGNSFDRTKQCLKQSVQYATRARIKAITEKNRIKLKADSISSVVFASLLEIKETAKRLNLKKDELQALTAKIAITDSLAVLIKKHSSLEDFGMQKSLAVAAMVSIDTIQNVIKSSAANAQSKNSRKAVHVALHRQ